MFRPANITFNGLQNDGSQDGFKEGNRKNNVTIIIKIVVVLIMIIEREREREILPK